VGPAAAATVGHDPELEAALKAVLRVVFRDHPLNANQILVLASELQRLGTHRLVEEHFQKHQPRAEPGGG
jgi:hypothetical protein